jgi:hypothetical protein
MIAIIRVTSVCIISFSLALTLHNFNKDKHSRNFSISIYNETMLSLGPQALVRRQLGKSYHHDHTTKTVSKSHYGFAATYIIRRYTFSSTFAPVRGCYTTAVVVIVAYLCALNTGTHLSPK